MVALYTVWYWVSTMCPYAAFWSLFFNDGGVFSNECYYMFYNGVVWYKPPKPFKRAKSLLGDAKTVGGNDGINTGTAADGASYL